jgi:hypothetical protein
LVEILTINSIKVVVIEQGGAGSGQGDKVRIVRGPIGLVIFDRFHYPTLATFAIDLIMPALNAKCLEADMINSICGGDGKS